MPKPYRRCDITSADQEDQMPKPHRRCDITSADQEDQMPKPHRPLIALLESQHQCIHACLRCEKASALKVSLFRLD